MSKPSFNSRASNQRRSGTRERFANAAKASRLPLLGALLALPLASAKDWPMWGGTPSRNMVAEAHGIPDDINSGKFLPKTETIDPKTTKNVRWIAKLGSQAYGSPVVAGGRVFVGTNNEAP